MTKYKESRKTSLEVWMQDFSVGGKVKLLLLNHEGKCKTQVRNCGEYDWTGGGGSLHLIIILGVLQSGHVPQCITAGQLIYLISSWSRQFTAVINVLVSSLYHNISIVCHFSSKLEQHSAPVIANLSRETAIKHQPIEWHQPKWQSDKHYPILTSRPQHLFINFLNKITCLFFIRPPGSEMFPWGGTVTTIISIKKKSYKISRP